MLQDGMGWEGRVGGSQGDELVLLPRMSGKASGLWSLYVILFLGATT